MTIHAYEIDGGPSGRWWELDDDTKPEAEGFMGTEATRERAAARGATVFHTYDEWLEETIREDAEFARKRESAEEGGP